MNQTCAIILAAGEGKRMKTTLPKVLTSVMFKPMIKWVIDSVNYCGIDNICVVSGYKHEDVQKYLNSKNINYYSVVQKERKGTAHAVMTASDFLNMNLGKDVLILGGDAPFIDADTIIKSYELHNKNKNAVTVISAIIDNPYGYGRIVRDNVSNKLYSIVEQKDANDEVKLINEVNSGAYWFNIEKLISVLPEISNNNNQNEYYLPDAIHIFLNKGYNADAYLTPSKQVVLGANDCEQLHYLNKIAREHILKKLLKNGVHIPCMDGIMIGPDVKISESACIMPNTTIYGNSIIGKDCIIGPNSQVIDSIVEDGSIVNSSYCKNSVIKKQEILAPFSCIINN